MHIEAIAPRGLHKKILEITDTLPGENYLDAPAGYGALTNHLLMRGHNVVAADIDISKFKIQPSSKLTLIQHDLNEAAFMTLPLGTEPLPA